MTPLKWALIALVLSLIAGVFGFTNLSAASAKAAKIFFYIFVALFVLLQVLGLTVFKAARDRSALLRSPAWRAFASGPGAAARSLLPSACCAARGSPPRWSPG
jgi:uncharacterized membrane protein YtjA (UPF0391 family)